MVRDSSLHRGIHPTDTGCVCGTTTGSSWAPSRLYIDARHLRNLPKTPNVSLGHNVQTSDSDSLPLTTRTPV